MNELIISFPSSYEVEKKYIARVIFHDFLGILYQVRFLEESTYVIITSMCGNGQLVLPEVLFSTPLNLWLSKKSQPTLPLRVRLLDDLSPHQFINSSVPVLYGQECVSKQQTPSYFDIDLLGSIFFCLTLYEEMSYVHLDEFKRYPFYESIMYKANVKDRAIVNEYVDILWHLLNTTFPKFRKKDRSYVLNLTHDVDKPRTFYNSSYGFIKECAKDVLLHQSTKVLFSRLKSKLLRCKRCDPYNTFSYLMTVSEMLGVKSEFNFIPINGKGSIDGSYDINSYEIKKLMLEIHDRGHVVGFHPSFNTFCDKGKTIYEYERLTSVCKQLGIRQKYYGGRQHYLRWRNPDTWRIWSEIGLDYDSSVGWRSISGFRAGTCFAYPVFDLVARQELQLQERPLHVMELSRMEYATEDEFQAQVVSLSKICKYHQGELVLLFHNDRVLSMRDKIQYEALLEKII